MSSGVHLYDDHASSALRPRHSLFDASTPPYGLHSLGIDPLAPTDASSDFAASQLERRERVHAAKRSHPATAVVLPLVLRRPLPCFFAVLRCSFQMSTEVRKRAAVDALAGIVPSDKKKAMTAENGGAVPKEEPQGDVRSSVFLTALRLQF